MNTASHPALRRNLTLCAAALAVAAAAFWATMLIAPPISEALTSMPAEATPAVTICEVLPTGDVVNCSIQN